MDGTTKNPPAKPTRGRKRPRQKMELHMNFLPKSLRAPELFGLLAAIPAAFAGSVLFAHMLDAASRIVV
jgi:hypothetical protein